MAVLRFAYLLANIVFCVLLSTEVCASIEWNNIIKSSTLLGSSSSRNEADRFSNPWNSANRISKQFQNHAITLKDEFLRQQVSQIFWLHISTFSLFLCWLFPLQKSEVRKISSESSVGRKQGNLSKINFAFSRKSLRNKKNFQTENELSDKETEHNYYHYYHVITAAV